MSTARPSTWAVHQALTGRHLGARELPMRTGGNEDIEPFFDGLRQPWLCIIGAAGTGKSVLARQLGLDLLDRRATGPVPVYVDLARWNPAEQSLEAWLAAEIRALAKLRGSGSDVNTADLVDSGRILPILDGLDAMPARAQGEALARLATSRLGRNPYVLTSRTEEFTRAATAPMATVPELVVIQMTSIGAGASAPSGDDRRGEPPMTEELMADIRAEVRVLPEIRIRLASDTDDRQGRQIDTMVTEILRRNPGAVRSRGVDDLSRMQAAHKRMIAGLRRPAWARPARVYQALAWCLVVVLAVASAVMLAETNVSVGLMALGLGLASFGVIRRVLRSQAHRPAGQAGSALTPTLFGGTLLMAGVGSYLLHSSMAASTLLAAVSVAAAFLWVVALLAWLQSRPYELRLAQLASDDPMRWQLVPDIEDYRDAAMQARADWLATLAREGVMPQLRPLLGPGPDEFGDVLPPLDLSRFGSMIKDYEYVHTAATRRVERLVRELTSASIGISGQRGVGKSTVLKWLCDPTGKPTTENLLVLVSAPTSYDRREFLLYLFGKVCREVLADTDPGRRRHRSWGWVRAVIPTAAVVVGLLAAVGAVIWTWLLSMFGMLSSNLRITIGVAGVLVAAAGIGAAQWISRRPSRSPQGSYIEVVAAEHLRRLQFQMSTSVTRDGKLGLPGGSQLGTSGVVQHTEHLRTYPELVGEFREFLTDVAEQRRPRGGRIIIGIDELDKMAKAEEAERFLNDLKAIFGILGCYFLVAVSEDALATFDRRALAVRSAFDSAFDEIVQVQPLSLSDARAVIKNRGVSLPEPYLRLCHALSGGIPRDLLRCVLTLAMFSPDEPDLRLDPLARRMICQDVASVMTAQLKRTETLTDSALPETSAWLARAAVTTTLETGAFKDLISQAPSVGETSPLSRVIEQTSVYLSYLLVVWQVFVERRWPMLLERYEQDAGIDLLAAVRGQLPASPDTAEAKLRQFEDAYLA